MNQFDQQWRKLTSLARQARDPRDSGAPYGFSTRVAAHAAGMPFDSSSVPFENFALRGLVVAAVCGIAAIAFDYATFVTSTQTDAYVAADMVGDLLDLS
jgi:hypothetical protein